MQYGFSCRGCAKLHYASQSEGYSDRLARKIWKLRKRIWGNTYHDINNLFEQSYGWPRPKRLHLKTFIRLQGQLLNLEAEYWRFNAARLKQMLGE